MKKATMKDIWYESKGVRLYGVEQGDGPVLVMLHGAGGDHHACLPIVAPLTARYHVITPDLRGSGKSWCAAPLTWNVWDEDLAALLDHIGASRAIVGGISGGTGAALGFARQFSARTAGLVLVNPVYGGENRGLTEYQATTFRSLEPFIAKARAGAGLEAFRPLYQKSPQMEAFFDSILGLVDPNSFIATNEFMASCVQPFASARDLETIAAPTLLIPGNDLMHPPDVSVLYAASIPKCTLIDVSSIADFDARNAATAAAIADFCARIAAW
jgi:3-oxoadipate enol-lactonase